MINKQPKSNPGSVDSRRLDSEDGTPGTFSLGVSRYKTNEKN